MSVRPAKIQISLGYPPCLISLRYALSGKLRTQAFFMRTAKTDQTGRMPRLIRVFVGRQPHCWVCHVAAHNYTLVLTLVQHKQTSLLFCLKYVPFSFIFLSELLWILTREQAGIRSDVRDGILSMLRGYGINTDKLSPTDQNNCP